MAEQAKTWVLRRSKSNLGRERSEGSGRRSGGGEAATAEREVQTWASMGKAFSGDGQVHVCPRKWGAEEGLREVFGVESFYSSSGGQVGLGWRGRVNRCLNPPYDMTGRHSWEEKRWSVVTFPHDPWQKPSSSPALTHMSCAQPPSPIASLATFQHLKNFSWFHVCEAPFSFRPPHILLLYRLHPDTDLHTHIHSYL